MSEMIERVAKAMAEELDDLDVRGLHIAARAAIAAMREPTPEMILAGDGAEGYSEGDIIGIWRAMIDEALK